MVRLEDEHLFEIRSPANYRVCSVKSSILAAAKCIEAGVWWRASSRPALPRRTFRNSSQHLGVQLLVRFDWWEARVCVMYLVFNGLSL